MAKHGGSGTCWLGGARGGGVEIVRGYRGKGDLRGRREDRGDGGGCGVMRGGGTRRYGGQRHFGGLGAMSAIDITSREGS